ncbi:MAG: 16S rRNA (guanine(527)-N(7))-methyltransferase RsmG [Planctomycetota bacterium]|jgi:16S rRNA (guanine527-N7)-methyltransferase
MEDLIPTARKLGFELTEAHVTALTQYRERLVDGNTRAALSRLTGPRSFWQDLVLDALLVGAALPGRIPEQGPLRIVDIGSGGGAPAIPLALTLPAHRSVGSRAIHVHCVEPTRKKADFLESCREPLSVSDTLSVACERSEALARVPEHRDAYDLATARAVAKLCVLAEYTLPFVKPGGYLIAWKGGRYRDEIEAALPALRKLGASFEVALPSPIEGRGTVLVCIRKDRPTPKAYPRAVGVPKKEPLR